MFNSGVCFQGVENVPQQQKYCDYYVQLFRAFRVPKTCGWVPQYKVCVQVHVCNSCVGFQRAENVWLGPTGITLSAHSSV